MGLSVYIPGDEGVGRAPGETTLGNAFLQERVALYGFGGFMIAATFFIPLFLSASGSLFLPVCPLSDQHWG